MPPALNSESGAYLPSVLFKQRSLTVPAPMVAVVESHAAIKHSRVWALEVFAQSATPKLIYP